MSYSNGPRIVTNGLVLCLDAGNSKSYPGSGTVWTDLSGLGNNGILTNGPTFNSGNAGSIVFDGINDHVLLSNSNLISASRSTGFTISSWVYSNSTSNLMALCGSGDNSFSGFNTLNLRVNASSSNAVQAGSVRVAVSTGSGPFKILSGATNTNNITINRWHNIVAAVLPINNSINIYINGINQLITYALQQAPDSFSNFTSLFAVGAINWADAAPQQYFSGRISNFTFYNKILSTSEVLQNYNALKGRYNL